MEEPKENTDNMKFVKKQIIKSAEFSTIEKDCLSFLLKDNKQYTVLEAKNLLKEYFKIKLEVSNNG